MRPPPVLGALLLVGGCTQQAAPNSALEPTSPPALAAAELRDASGAVVANAALGGADEALTLSLTATHLPPGTHGVHVHTVGRCDPPDFNTAGGHWNPMAHQHGAENPHGPHGGDLPNLVVAADGSGSLSGRLPAGTLAELFDSDGAALVIHASADDLRTDPSGNSGARIACGVLTRR